MTPQPRLVATDLDGTLLRSDGSLSRRTGAALRSFEDAGGTVVFVTGRPLRWAREVFAHVGGHGLAVISNGALVWDVAADRARSIHPIPVAVGLEVCELLRAAVPGTTYAVESVAGLALEPEFLERHPVPADALRGPVEQIFSRPALKLLARHEELGAQAFWDAAEAVVGDRVEVTWSSTSTLLEISAKGVTKASTLAELCSTMGLGASDVVAFGDMPNDQAMLRWAGTSYAMANAHPSVLDIADHTAAANDDDGVARVLEALLGLP